MKKKKKINPSHDRDFSAMGKRGGSAKVRKGFAASPEARARALETRKRNIAAKRSASGITVKIIKGSRTTGVKKGEIYKAIPYPPTPTQKVLLQSRIPDGFNPSCTAPYNRIRILKG
jgi:hypothetical protein